MSFSFPDHESHYVGFLCRPEDVSHELTNGQLIKIIEFGCKLEIAGSHLLNSCPFIVVDIKLV